jgi:hypothetical protein
LINPTTSEIGLIKPPPTVQTIRFSEHWQHLQKPLTIRKIPEEVMSKEAYPVFRVNNDPGGNE